MSQDARGPSAAGVLTAFVAYALLAVLVSWPLAAHLADRVPHDVGDPVLNTWILWWNAHAVPFTARWWNAPAFWPTPGVLTFSEHLAGLGVIATPVQWLGGSAQLAYNLTLFLSWPLSAVSAYYLLHRLTGRADAAAIGGLVFGFNPYRVEHIPHIQVLVSWWMPLALAALHRAIENARAGRRVVRPIVAFGVCWLMQALSNGYYLFFFSFLVALWMLWFVPWREHPRFSVMLVLSWIGFAVPLAPILLKYQAVHLQWHLVRDVGEMKDFSANLLSFVTASPYMRFWPIADADMPEQSLYPGIVALLLALAGPAIVAFRAASGGRRAAISRSLFGLALVFGIVALITIVNGPWEIGLGPLQVSARRFHRPLGIALALAIAGILAEPRLRAPFARRSPLVFYLGATLLVWLACLGPAGRLLDQRGFDYPPYYWLMKLPGIDSLRVPARFAMVAALTLACAAALAFARLTATWSARSRTIAAGAILALIAADSLTTGIPMMARPQRLVIPPSVPADAAVLELPYARTVDADVAAMYRETEHGHPVVNGYSGHFPPTYSITETGLNAGDRTTVLALASYAPVLLVFDPDADDQWPVLARRAQARLVGRDGNRALYLVARQPFPLASGPPAPIASVSSNYNPNALARLHDGDPYSSWDANVWQRGDEEITVDIGSPMRVGGVSLALGARLGDYPRILRVDTSRDGSTWTTVLQTGTAGYALKGVLDDVRHMVVRVPFPPTEARYVRLRQLGHETDVYWSIGELVINRAEQGSGFRIQEDLAEP